MDINETQTFLEVSSKNISLDRDTNKIKILNWNIGNPSLQRAYNQIKWLEQNNADILILTEFKVSKGCLFLKDRLINLGYAIHFPNIENDNYGVMIAVKTCIEKKKHDFEIKVLPHRAPSIKCKLLGKEIIITGIYVPPTNGSFREEFHTEFEKVLKNSNVKHWVILGDLNIPRPDLIISEKTDKYNTSLSRKIYLSFIDNGLIDALHFLDKADLSIERKGEGYRPDNIFVSKSLIKHVEDCYYEHEARKSKLSDHSPMLIELNLLRNNSQ